MCNEIAELQRIIDDLQSDLVGATNDYKQAQNEINLLNKQITRQLTDIERLNCIVEENNNTIKHYIKENDELKFKLKMLRKVFFNSIYGITGTIYADTDSNKGDKDNDSNN